MKAPVTTTNKTLLSFAEEWNVMVHSSNRHLATLRLPSDENATDSSDSKDWFAYTPSAIVSDMHRTPRFGHSNHVGLLVSSNPNAPMDYAQGIKKFTLFYLVVPFFLWAILLVTFQRVYKVQRVGCAAGGEVLDMYVLSKPPHSLSRKERKRRIHRSWRLQSTFMVASICVPVVSIVMMTIGLSTTTMAIQELQDWIGDVETLAYRGWTAVDGLKKTQHQLFDTKDNELVRGILQYYHSREKSPSSLSSASSTTSTTQASVPATELSEVDAIIQNHHPDELDNTSNSNNTSPTSTMHGVFVDTWCPGTTFQHNGELAFLIDAMETIEENTHNMLQIFDHFVTTSANYSSTMSVLDDSFFRIVTDTTAYVDSTLEWSLQNDWILKFLILAINVVNFLLLMDVYILSKNNIIHLPTRTYVAYVLIPFFIFLLVAVMVLTMIMGIYAVINADFCSGGVLPGSVQGTLEDAILSWAQYGNLDRTTFNGTNESVTSLEAARKVSPMAIAYSAVQFYASGCLTDNPLKFLDTVSDHMDAAVAHVNQLASIVPNDEGTLERLNEACGGDMSFLFPALTDLNEKLAHLQFHLSHLTEIASCSQISPLFRRISHGAMCIESPKGLTALWSCGFLLCILGFVMLTTRAALYNSVKRKKRRDKKPRRVVEKEFSEYKDFMSQYYEGTDGWMLDQPLPPETPPKATKITLEFDDGLETKPTFETAVSSHLSSKDDDLEDDHDHRKKGASARSRVEGASEIGGIHNSVSRLWDDDSYGSSYDSEISDDSVPDEGDSINDDDQQSAMVSFFSETKSMAMQTIHSIQKIQPLLASLAPGLLMTNRHDGNDPERHEDDSFLFQHRDIGVISGTHGATRTTMENCHNAWVESSVCDESLYVGTTSICEPPTTPGLLPVPLLESHIDYAVDDDENNCSQDIAYANSHAKTANVQDGLWKGNRKARWFGQSVRNPSKKSIGSRNEEEVFDGPSLLEALTPSSVISALTPLAPYKPFSYLTRANADKEMFSELFHGDTDIDDDGRVFEDEGSGDEGTNGRCASSNSGLSVFSLSPGVPTIRPTKLEMSPLLMTPVKLNKSSLVRTDELSRSCSRPEEQTKEKSRMTNPPPISQNTVCARRKINFRDENEDDNFSHAKEEKQGTRRSHKHVSSVRRKTVSSFKSFNP